MENVENMKIYVSSKLVHAPMWQKLRQLGHNIISTWIDEAGEGETTDYSDLARRCINEAAEADVIILYCEPNETLKGALIEVGAALAAGKQVRLVGDCPSISPVFRKHENWSECSTVDEALAI